MLINLIKNYHITVWFKKSEKREVRCIVSQRCLNILLHMYRINLFIRHALKSRPWLFSQSKIFGKWKTNIPETKCHIILTWLYILFHLYRVCGKKCSGAVCTVVHHWITRLTLGGPARVNTLRGLSRSTSMHRTPALSPEWPTTTPLLLLPLPRTLDAYFQAPSSIFLSPTENEWVHTGGCKIMDGDSWEHCLRNTTGTCVYQKKNEHAHSIMWQSETKQSMLLYGRQLNQQQTVLSSF